jgi:TorA maturation chaperone TorD
MYQLCRREVEQGSTGKDNYTAIALEEEFLREHLGAWIGDYCTQAELFARTALYRGFLILLGAFIKTEMEYLQGIVSVRGNNDINHRRPA